MEEIKKYIKILKPKDLEITDELLEFCILETMDRVKLYLNREDLNKKLNRIIAKIVNANIQRTINDLRADTENIISISDNGQSVTYSNEVKRHFINVNDDDLIFGFSEILKPYRRLNIVYPEFDERKNS